MGVHQRAVQRLYTIAAAQQGFFTAKEALAAGFSQNTHGYHVRAGNWVREHRGLYRLPMIRQGEHPELVLWTLWSRNREGRAEGVYSHRTALSLHKLYPANPGKLHMTAPMHFRRSSATPTVLVLHRADLSKGEIMAGDGFRLTRPLRTILDLVAANAMPRNLLRLVLLRMAEQGRITRGELRQANMPAETRQQFEELLRAVHTA